MLPDLISLEQGAFVNNRSIFENVGVTQEMLNRFNSKTWGSNIMLKLDMTKAYDRLDWNFLKKILHSFGFGEDFIQLINYCVTIPKVYCYDEWDV